MSRANGITRQEILTAIKCNGTMTAEELSRELNISQVAVRQHLASLEAENIIAITVERRGLGRPSHRYRLTPHGDETFPRRYEALAESLIEELGEWQGEAAVQNLFARRRERYIQLHESRFKDRPLDEQIKELARWLTEKGFMARATEGEGENSYRLVLHNCAICVVARRFPNICCLQEMEMIQQLLGDVKIEREKYIMAGDHTCTYRIRRLLPEEMPAASQGSTEHVVNG